MVTGLMMNAHLIDTDTCEIDFDLVQTAFVLNEWCEHEFSMFSITSILSPAHNVGLVSNTVPNVFLFKFPN